MSSELPTPDRVSTLELFFDLVFVFTITQVSAVVVHSPNAIGLIRAVLELSIISWMYGGYAWMTNAVSSETWDRRLLLLLGMAAFFVCALAVPRAMGQHGDDDGLVFGVGYLLVTLIHLSGLLIGSGKTPLHAVYRLAPWNLASAGLVLAAGWTTGTADWVLWTLAIAVQVVTPIFARVDTGFVLNAAHFAERHGLMILIVLGESVVSLGFAAEEHRVDLSLIVGALAGLMLAGAMWWAYFVGDDSRAAVAFEAAPARRRADQAILGYGLAHLFMLCGVVAVAAGTKLAIHQLTSPMPEWDARLIAAGAALYLFGSATFRLVMRFGVLWPRLLGAAACLAAAATGTYGSAAAELAVLALTIAAMLVVESRADGARVALRA